MDKKWEEINSLNLQKKWKKKKNSEINTKLQDIQRNLCKNLFSIKKIQETS